MVACLFSKACGAISDIILDYLYELWYSHALQIFDGSGKTWMASVVVG
jgi:hypothetical protein